MERQLTILYCSTTNAIGGAELSLFLTAKFMTEQGHKVLIALPPSKSKQFTFLLKDVTESIFYVKTMRSTNTSGLSIWQKVFYFIYSSYKSGGWHITPVFKLCRIIKRHKVDIVHTNTLLTFDPSIAAFIMKVPHIQHIREITGNEPDALFRLSYQGSEFFKRILRRLNSKIICNSQYTYNRSKNYFPEDILVVVYNPIGFTKMEKKRITRESIKISSMANITARMKNHSFIIDVAHEFQTKHPEIEAQFLIYGSLPNLSDSYLSMLKNKVQQYGLSEIVQFPGQFPAEDILCHSDFLIHPYEGESFGRIFVEAMACGVPVLAVRGGGASELIQDGQTGFLFSKNEAAACADKLFELSQKQDLRSMIAKRGKKFASSFTPDKVGPQIEMIYFNALMKKA